jgi:hypothetical protein
VGWGRGLEQFHELFMSIKIDVKIVANKIKIIFKEGKQQTESYFFSIFMAGIFK